ncbi:MAG: hypothetical protein ACOY3P_21685, partial [Planctomycetota bacterium]
MPADRETLELIQQAGRLLYAEPAPPQDDTAALLTESHNVLSRLEESRDRRRNYIRDKYAWGLVAPLKGTRLDYSKAALKEIVDPEERQWLVEEVGKIARMQEWAQRKDYSESSYPGRLGANLQKVGGAFAEAGTGMVEAA